MRQKAAQLIVLLVIFLFPVIVLASVENADITTCTSPVNSCCAGSYSRPTLRWNNSSPYGTSYQIAYWVQIDDNNQFLSPSINTNPVSSYMPNYTVPADILTDYTTYYWRVKIAESNNVWTDWAVGDSFSIPLSSCSCDYGISNPETEAENPSSDAQVCTQSVEACSCCTGTQTPTMRWNIVSANGKSFQTAYWVKVDNNSDFSSPVIDTGLVSSIYNSYTPAKGILDDGTLYYWKVGVNDNYNSWTGFVNGDSFQFVDCDYAAGIAPNPYPVKYASSNFNACSSSVDQPACYSGYFPTPTFNFTFTSNNGQTNLTGYWVQVDNNSDFSSPEFDSGAVSSSSSYHKVCVDALDFGATYYWRASLKDSVGSWSDMTAGESFTVGTPCAPTIPVLQSIINIPTVCYAAKVTWTDSSNNETGFLVQNKQEGSSTWTDFCSTGSNSDGEADCTGNLLPSTSYYFRVKSTGEYADSDWSPSATGQAHTTSYCLPVVSIGAYNCESVTINWTQSGTGVSHYEVWRKKASSSEWKNIADDIPSSQFTYTDNDIISQLRYEYKVKAQSGSDSQDSASVGLTPCPKLPKWREVKPQ